MKLRSVCLYALWEFDDGTDAGRLYEVQAKTLEDAVPALAAKLDTAANHLAEYEDIARRAKRDRFQRMLNTYAAKNGKLKFTVEDK